MAEFIPVVEISDDRYLTGIGRPYGKMHTREFAFGHDMRAHFVVELKVTTLIEEVDVIGRQHEKAVACVRSTSIGNLVFMGWHA